MAESRDKTNNEGQCNKQTEFFIQGPLSFAASLYHQLPTNEDEFKHVAAIAWEDGRTYYLYGAADEVAKAGIAIMRWAKLLSGPQESLPDDPRERHADRMTLESIFDEQQMWQRKLTEWLANLVCFSSTNHQAYYRLFLAAQAYDYQIAELSDLRDYYNCDCGNARLDLRRILKRLNEQLVAVDPGVCWFLIRRVFDKLPCRPGRMFSSVKHRLSMAIKLANSGERICLGMSYLGSFGKASRSIHPTITDPRGPVTNRDLSSNLMTVSLIAMHVMHRGHELAGFEPTGLAKQIASRFRDSNYPALLIKTVHEPRYGVGDLVVALGHLAEVLEGRISKYGLESYRVRYLVSGPVDDMMEDCVPANWTSVVFRKSWSRTYLKQRWGAMPETYGLLPALDSQSDEELPAWLRARLMDLEKRGVPLDRLSHPPEEDEAA